MMQVFDVVFDGHQKRYQDFKIIEVRPRRDGTLLVIVKSMKKRKKK